MFRAACKRLGLRQSFIRPYTPKTNGKAERFIQTALREWAYAQAHQDSAQRTAEPPNWLQAKTPISRLGLAGNNLLRFHS
jgi:transposase InsO family protein